MFLLTQVFRSSIDAAYLPLLQDWLVCSVNNFLPLSQTKAIWCLTVIFVSSSLNLHLLQMFPHLLRIIQQQKVEEDYIDPRLIHLFVVATKDFFDKLSKPQKQVIADCFSNSAHTTMQYLGRALTDQLT